MPKVSVIVCSHNPREDYLARTLDGLRQQTLPLERWELVVVDNASARPLSGVIDLSWHPHARHVREDVLGLTPARFRGIAETTGELIVFVDDDNVLAPDYLEEAIRIAADYPHVGVFGSGCLEPEFEVPPPPEVRRHMPLLTVRKVPMPRWSNHADDYVTIPWGAGLVVPRPIASVYQDFTEQLDITGVLGRRGKSLYAGEDDLFSLIAISRGLGFGIFPKLRVAHLIGKHRLTGDHVINLIHDHAFSTGVRHFVTAGLPPKRIDAFAIAHLVLHGLRRGMHAMRCRWASISGSHQAARFIAEHELRPLGTRQSLPIRPSSQVVERR